MSNVIVFKFIFEMKFSIHVVMGVPKITFNEYLNGPTTNNWSHRQIYGESNLGCKFKKALIILKLFRINKSHSCYLNNI